MIRAVPDVNIFVSWAIKRGGHAEHIFERTGEFWSFTSAAILVDVGRVLRYDHLRKLHKLTDAAIDEFVSRASLQQRMVPGKLNVEVVSKDPEDNIIVACALEAKADYLISGDHHLLNLKHYREIQIVSPAAFLEILDRERVLKRN